MSVINVMKSIVTEYGLSWAINRALYSAKLKMISGIPGIDKIFEKKASFPSRIDIFQIDTEELRKFLRNELTEEDKKKLVDTADKICEGIIIGFNSIELNYGKPIDWQLNPLTGERCNEHKKWYKIPDFDSKRGDIKVIWEVSRLSHFVTFARAFMLTGDSKYYKAFSFQLNDWLDKNEYGCGANYKCGQEASIRMVNALLSYTVFHSCGVTTDKDAANIKSLINRSYRKVLSNFRYAYKCIKNNHTISELMGMIIGAWSSEDSRRLGKAYKILDKVIDEQFTDDGGYKQFSFNYQRLVLQDIEIILSVEQKTGSCLNEKSKRKIKKAVELMYQCQDETGDMPNYGSNDGALVFPTTFCGYRDFRPVINTIYALTTGKQVYEKGKYQEELLWFSGRKNLDNYNYEKVERVSQQYLKAGLFTIRGRNSWAMIVANDYHSRPAHMDQLHFDLWINGINVFCDAGTYSYASDLGRKLIKNESHNAAWIESVSQMNSYGPFMIMDWTRRKLEKVNATEFEGVIYTKTGYMHKRAVCLRKDAYEILDTVDKDAYILFHTPCNVEIDKNVARVSYNNKLICELKIEEDLELRGSKRSLFYLRDETISTIVIRAYADRELKTIIKVKGEIRND